MPDTFATEEPPATDDVTVTGIFQDRTVVWAYAGVVVIENYQNNGEDEADNFMSVDTARALVQNLNSAIIAASLLASAEPTTIRRIPIGRVP